MEGRVRRTVYDQLLLATESYLGPPSKRFIDRQILSHLDKNPARIMEDDVKILEDWLVASISLLINDQAIVSRYTHDLSKIYEKENHTRANA